MNEDWLDKVLDNLSYWSIQAILWVGITFWVVIFGFILLGAFAEDTDRVIGLTDHGIIIRESDLEIEENE